MTVKIGVELRTRSTAKKRDLGWIGLQHTLWQCVYVLETFDSARKDTLHPLSLDRLAEPLQLRITDHWLVQRSPVDS